MTAWSSALVNLLCRKLTDLNLVQISVLTIAVFSEVILLVHFIFGPRFCFVSIQSQGVWVKSDSFPVWYLTDRHGLTWLSAPAPGFFQSSGKLWFPALGSLTADTVSWQQLRHRKCSQVLYFEVYGWHFITHLWDMLPNAENVYRNDLLWIGKKCW